jgi:hypothetical protein
VAATVPTLGALHPDTRASLRRLAIDTLDQLGIMTPTRAMIDDEMTRQFAQLARAVPAEGDPEDFLRQAIDRALESIGR